MSGSQLIRAPVRGPVAEWDNCWVPGRGVDESIPGEPGYTVHWERNEQATSRLRPHQSTELIYHEYIIQIYTQTDIHMCVRVHTHI